MWTLALLARCYLAAGKAVTAEGLFRAALDGSCSVGEQKSEAASMPILFSSPIHPYSKAATLRGYSELLLQWENREAEGENVARQAETVSQVLTSLLASNHVLCLGG